jgi:hypothetical protein
MVIRTKATFRADSTRPVPGSPAVSIASAKEEMTLRAEEGDESIGELADEAAKTKKELRESTETGAKVQKESKDSDKQH